MRKASWADLASAAENAAPGSSDGNGAPRPTRGTYVPPHLRNRAPQSSDSAAPPQPASFHANDRAGPAGYNNMARSGGGGYGHQGYDGRTGGGWNNRIGRWDRGRDHEVNPFGDDVDAEGEVAEQENTGINFDAYEDIPVETSGDNVPPPVGTFAEIDLGDALNQNIKRCKFVRPTPVQRHAIPISLAGRDLMACAQTGSGKTAAFCFPIISGIMRGQYAQRPRGSRTVFPLALILSPTRELSCQVILLPLYDFPSGL